MKQQTATNVKEKASEAGFGGALDVSSAADQVIGFFKNLEEEKKYVKTASTYLKKNPWLSLGIGFGVGLLLGAVVSPKR